MLLHIRLLCDGVFCEDILYQVSAHLQGGLMFLGWVAVHIKVFPAIAQVGLIAIEAYQAAFVYEAIALGWLAIVLVYLGQAVGKGVLLMIDGIREWQFYQLQVGEDFFESRTHIGVQAVIIIYMQEATTFQVFAQVLCFIV